MSTVGDRFQRSPRLKMRQTAILLLLIVILDLRNDVMYTVEANVNRSTCTIDEAKLWSYDFHDCFFDRKYKDGGRDLNNIVDRILDHCTDCIKNSTRECKPNKEGFMIIMDKVIEQMKEYCYIYLEHIIHDRDKVKDLKCVEDTLKMDTYRNCFENTFSGNTTSQQKFEKEVQKSISCVNESNKPCSKAAKTSLNQLVRNIVGVKQPAKEDIEDDPKPAPYKPWYQYIFDPFVSMWNAIKSFFGF